MVSQYVGPLPPTRRVLCVDDDGFGRALIADSLESAGFSVRAVETAGEFVQELELFDPHAVLLDLDLGDGPSGLQLLKIVQRDAPWVGKVILSSHRAARFVDPEVVGLDDVSYLVKPDLTSSAQIVEAIEASVRGDRVIVNDTGAAISVSKTQADVLRMIADGLSNSQIAEARGCSQRAVEQLVRRTFAAIGITGAEQHSPRVLAATMLARSEVAVDE